MHKTGVEFSAPSIPDEDSNTSLMTSEAFMAQSAVAIVEAARRRVALVDDMLTETRQSEPYLGRARNLENLKRELADQKRKLTALETSAPVRA